MGQSAQFSDQFLKLIFNAVGIPNLADNAASAPLSSLYCSLHTADPTAAGNQSSSEMSYTGYARVAVARSASGFAVSGATVQPVSAISFGTMTSGTSGVASFAAFGYAVSGATEIIYSGPISPTITVTTGVTPQLTTATVITVS